DECGATLSREWSLRALPGEEPPPEAWIAPIRLGIPTVTFNNGVYMKPPPGEQDHVARQTIPIRNDVTSQHQGRPRRSSPRPPRLGGREAPRHAGRAGNLQERDRRQDCPDQAGARRTHHGSS